MGKEKIGKGTNREKDHRKPAKGPPDKATHAASKKRKSKTSRDKHKEGKKRDRQQDSKKQRRQQAGSSSSGSSSGSDSDAGPGGVQRQLQRERAAVTTLRDILANHPAVRKDLREMLWRVDQGETANIASIPDVELKESIRSLLELLKLHRNNKGTYGLLERTQGVLPIVGFVFDEPPPAPRAKPLSAAADRTVVPALPVTTTAGTVKSELDKAGVHAPLDTPQMRTEREPPGEISPAPSDSLSAGAGAAAIAAAAELASSAEATSALPGTSAAAADSAVPAVQSRRAVGPAMPPRELLAAAAAAAAAMAAAESADAAGNGQRGGGFDMVGPPPPELLLETEAVPQNDREAVVVSIMQQLRALKGDQAAEDAYSILSLDPTCTSTDVKKRYMRLSLLIHPDKCNHPDAHEAFQAVSRAAKLLQDSGTRAALDAKRDDAELRKLAEAEAAKQERERMWRVARGEEVAGPSTLEPVGRQSWMTDLPEERKHQPVAMPQVSQTSFLAGGVKVRGDTSDWTDTPAQRAAREAQQLLQSASAAYAPLMIDGGGPASVTAASLAASALDNFNNSKRKKTLLEAHQEALLHPKQKKKKVPEVGASANHVKEANSRSGEGTRDGHDRSKSKAGPVAVTPAATEEDWVGKHPWRPFDREKDLQVGPKPKTAAELMRATGGLSNKFASGGTSRSFL